MVEINLLDMYPNRNRDTKARLKEKTPEMKAAAEKYGWEYFDKKGICYNGYNYDGRWIPIAKKFIEYYKLKPGSKILDVGCANGYFMYDLKNQGMNVEGIDISEYARDCAIPEIKQFILIGNAKDLSRYRYKEFDLVISLNTIHNLDELECREAIREIQRVGKDSFICVDSYRNDIEKERLFDWAITGRTLKSDKEWIKMFEEEGYTGDFFWFIP